MAELTNDDKVALLLTTLAPEAADSVLGRLPPAHAARVRSRVQALKDSPPEVLRQDSQEFLDVLRIAERSTEGVTAPSQAIPEVVVKPPEPEPVKEAAPPPADHAEGLRQCGPETLASALRGERASTAALVVNCLDVPRASAVLKLLPAEVRHEAAVRLGQPIALKPELVERILRSVLARWQEFAAKPAQPTGDALLARMADLVRNLGREDRKEILDRLEKSDADAAAKVRKSLYSFADVLRVDDRTLQGVLGEFTTQTLTLAIKGASEEIKTKLMNNVSRRAKETIQEEMELVANARAEQIEQAQAEFVAVLQRLDQEGTITL